MDEAALKHAAARKMMEAREKAAKTKVKKTGAAVTDRDGNPFSFKLENYRTLDSVKGLPSRDKKRGPSRHAHASGTRSEGRGASADSPSRASTSLTVRSAVQIRADRAFKENFNAVRAELQQPEQLAQLITGLKPLDAEGGQRGIGKDVTRVWKAKLRELTPQHSSHAQPVANNAMSRDGVPLKQPPGFFCQVPERLGRWRDDFGKIDASTGTEGKTGGVGQWVPETVVRRKEQERRHQEKQAALKLEKRAQEQREYDERERALQQKLAVEREAAAAAEARARVLAEEEEERKRKRAAKKAELQRKKAMAAERLSGSTSAKGRPRYNSHDGDD